MAYAEFAKNANVFNIEMVKWKFCHGGTHRWSACSLASTYFVLTLGKIQQNIKWERTTHIAYQNTAHHIPSQSQFRIDTEWYHRLVFSFTTITSLDPWTYSLTSCTVSFNIIRNKIKVDKNLKIFPLRWCEAASKHFNTCYFWRQVPKRIDENRKAPELNKTDW